MNTEISERHFQGVLVFGSGEPMLDGYTDSYMAGDVDSKKSISGFMMTLQGSCLLAIQATEMCCIIHHRS